MNIKKDLFYSKEHEWVTAKTGEVSVGVSAYAIDQLGDVVHIDVTSKIGDTLNPGDPFGTIESTKTVSDLYAPIGGEVLAINHELLGAASSIQDDPYTKGWIIKVRGNTPQEMLLDANSYEKYLKELD